MPRISSILTPAAVVAIGLGMAMPAQAAPEIHRQQGKEYTRHYTSFGQATSLGRDIARLDMQIDRALANHRISRREAFQLRRDVDRLEGLFDRFKRGGITRYEARTLESRIAQVDRALRAEKRDRNGWRG